MESGTSGSGGSSQKNRVVIQHPTANNIDFSPEEWNAFLTMLQRSEVSDLYGSGEKQAKTAYDKVIGLSPVTA